MLVLGDLVVVVEDRIFIKMMVVSKMMDFQITDKILRIKIYQVVTESVSYTHLTLPTKRIV